MTYLGGWKPGDFAIYSDFGLRSLYIVRVLDWPEEKGERFEGKYGVVHDRPQGSVRAEVVDTTLVDWDFDWQQEINEWNRVGTIHYYHYTNLFRNIEALIDKQSGITYPWDKTRMLYNLRQHPGWVMLAAYGLRNGKQVPMTKGKKPWVRARERLEGKEDHSKPRKKWRD